MAGATYLCVTGCLSECRHHVLCEIYMTDAEHPHPPKHFGMADDGRFHEWVGKGTGKCTITAPDEDD